MQTITFECEIITPMFLSGADGQTPELRAPSIKGALRFWWRALNGHLPLAELKKKEGEIFGGTGDNSSRSKIIVRVSQPKSLQTERAELVPHKPFMQQQAFQTGQSFEVHLSKMASGERDQFSMEQLKALFEVTCILGGLGKRVRRGMGSINILRVNGTSIDNQNVDLHHLHNLIKIFSPFYTHSKDAIHFTYSGRSEKYGFIKQIQLGNSQEEKPLLRTISDATHKVKEQSGFAYDPSMGHASRGRYASPVYVSVVKGSVRPIITTLNIAPDKNEHQASLLIQEDFKNRILK